MNEPLATCPLSALLATPTGLLAGWLVVQHCQLTKFPPMMQVSLSLSFARSGEGPPIYLDYVLLFQTCISLPVDLDLVCIYACYVPLTCTRATVVSQKTDKTSKNHTSTRTFTYPTELVSWAYRRLDRSHAGSGPLECITQAIALGGWVHRQIKYQP